LFVKCKDTLNPSIYEAMHAAASLQRHLKSRKIAKHEIRNLHDRILSYSESHKIFIRDNANDSAAIFG